MGRSLQVLHQLALHTKTLPEKAGKQANYLFWKFEELKKQKTKKHWEKQIQLLTML